LTFLIIFFNFLLLNLYFFLLALLKRNLKFFIFLLYSLFKFYLILCLYPTIFIDYFILILINILLLFFNLKLQLILTRFLIFLLKRQHIGCIGPIINLILNIISIILIFYLLLIWLGTFNQTTLIIILKTPHSRVLIIRMHWRKIYPMKRWNLRR
jgi:hypothetical protein